MLSTTRDISKEIENYHYKALTFTDEAYLTCLTTGIHFSRVCLFLEFHFKIQKKYFSEFHASVPVK